MAGGKVDALENSALDYELRAVAWTPGDYYAGLFTVSPTADAGTGGTEVSGGAYARQQITRASGSWAASSAGTTSNSNAVTFPVATANWGRVLTLGLWDALTVGNLRRVVPLVSGAYKNFAVTDLTNDDIECPAHGFTANQVVRFFPVGGTLPTGLAFDTRYFVIATGLTTDAFRVSATQGGAAINITAAGAGEVALDASFDVVTSSQISLAAGQLIITDD